MRKLLGTIAFAAALAAASGVSVFAGPPAAPADKTFLIRWNLFEGMKSKDAPASQVVLSTSAKVPSFLQLSEAAKSPAKDIAAIQRELVSIFQLESVKPVISNEWAWSRKNEKALNTLLLQEAVLPIAFTMQKRPGNMVSVRVQVAPPKPVSGLALVSRFDLVDMEFLAKYNESVVLGFTALDRSYFLAFEVLKSDAPESDPGLGSIVDEITFLPASRAISQTLPIYPPAWKAAGVGGTVILRVDLDAAGTVTRSEVLKGVHPDLDRTAREAVLGWKYEPVLKDGKPVPVSFAVSLSFNPDPLPARPEIPKEQEPQTPTPAKPSSAEAFNPRLAEILEKTADYCDKLKRASLDFICREQIKEWVLAGKTWTGEKHLNRFELLYEYQLVKSKDDITERRTLLEENGVKREEKNAPLKTQRFYSAKVVFGPTGFLSREWRDAYTYALLKEEKVDGRKAYVIEVRPKVKIEGKANFGKIWVDQADFSVLQIDIEQESLEGFETVAKQARDDGYKPLFTISHKFGIEKNGLRFPSQTVFNEVYTKRFQTDLSSWLPRVNMSNTTILYTDYKFFTVDTDVKYEPR